MHQEFYIIIGKTLEYLSGDKLLNTNFLVSVGFFYSHNRKLYEENNFYIL